jgi:DNA-binding transcriptional MerR regulator
VSPKRDQRWKVGDLATATGVLARTLHYYDEIGLLVPSERPPGGPRLYTEADVTRLYRIVVLRRLGNPVRKIPSLLGEGGVGLQETVRLHLDHVDQDRERQRRLRAPLLEILPMLDGPVEPTGDCFVEVLQAMSER